MLITGFEVLADSLTEKFAKPDYHSRNDKIPLANGGMTQRPTRPTLEERSSSLITAA
ncbi:MAG: hypothetical protein WCI18_08580 [Pseudomonadota bacterium]